MSALVFAALAWAQVTGVAEPALAQGEEVEGVVVTARRGTPVKSEPFEYYRRYCFEASRLTGRPAQPGEDSAWLPVDEATRESLKAIGPTQAAYDLVDSGRKLTMVLALNGRSIPAGLREERCTLMIFGPVDGRNLESEMERLFSGRGTQRHLDHPATKYERRPGWSQWLWSAIPARGSKSWAVWGENRNRHGSFISVEEPRFWSDHDYVAGVLEYKLHAARPVSVLTLVRTFKPRP
jgi:hypothetical protein